MVRKNKKFNAPVVKIVANERITSPRVMVIDETGQNLGEMSREEALELARSKDLDLLVVSAKEGAVVTKIGDISKLKYEKTKKLKKNKGKSSEMKEWWFKPSIQERDLIIRLEKIKKFLLKEGGTAKLTLKYVKRTPPDQMTETMKRINTAIEEFAKPISEVAKEGRNLSIIVKAL